MSTGTDSANPDARRLTSYVETWSAAADDVLTLLGRLEPHEWSRATDLPGWDVHDVAAHLAHLEAVLAGLTGLAGLAGLAGAVGPMDEGAGRRPGPVRTMPSSFTEAGVAARRGHTPERLVEELDAALRARREALRADPPTDPRATAVTDPVDWDWQTLLSNRIVDVWMHEQDVRRAVSRPGGLDTAAARHTVSSLAGALPFVLGKRVAPAAGTTVTLEITGPQRVHLAAEVGDDGRAKPLAEPPAAPTATARIDTEGFVVLAGGRRTRADVDVVVAGDVGLGERLLDALAITP